MKTETKEYSITIELGDFVRDNDTGRVMELTFIDEVGLIFDDVYFIFSLDFFFGVINDRFEVIECIPF